MTQRTIKDISGRPPTGTEVDWVEQENGLMEKEIVPGGDFRKVVFICNEIALSENEPGDGSGLAYQVGKKYNIHSDPLEYAQLVKSVWSNRGLYKEIAEKHYPNFNVYWNSP